MALSFTTIAKGNSEFIRRVGVPVAESLEEVLTVEGFERSEAWQNDEMLLLDRRRRADFMPVAGLVGALLFVTKDFVRNVLKDVYEIKIGPVLREKLKAGATPDEKANKALLFGAWLDDVRVLVLVLSSGKSMEDLAAELDRIPELVNQGLEFATASGSIEEVHVWQLEDGIGAESPRIYKDLRSALVAEGCA